MNRNFIFSLTFCFYIMSIGISNAQILPSTSGLNLSPSTNNPYPGQKITVTAKSFGDNISGATITWSVDGKQKLREIGVNKLEIVAPTLGKKTRVDVSVLTTENKLLNNYIFITSGSVDMIIESGGYTHALFKGKIPVVYQNSLKIIAVPHIANSDGIEYDPKNLVYTWKKNGRVLENQNGYGQQTINLVGDIVPRGYTITTTASTRDGSIQTEGRASISYSPPSISFYKNDPLYGLLFNSAIKNIHIGSEGETGILAVPFGFNKPISGIGNLIYSWYINGISQNNLYSKESIILRVPENSSGSSNVALEIKNNREFLQNISSSFNTSYTTNNSKKQNEVIEF